MEAQKDLYHGFMPRTPSEKKFETDIHKSLWEAYEKWADGRGRISNRQLAEALFRLFLAAPEGLKLLALYGRKDQLASAAECRAEFVAAQIVDATEADAARQRRKTRRKKGPPKAG